MRIRSVKEDFSVWGSRLHVCGCVFLPCKMMGILHKIFCYIAREAHQGSPLVKYSKKLFISIILHAKIKKINSHHHTCTRMYLYTYNTYVCVYRLRTARAQLRCTSSGYSQRSVSCVGLWWLLSHSMGLWCGGVANKSNLTSLNLDMQSMGLRCGGAVKAWRAEKKARTHTRLHSTGPSGHIHTQYWFQCALNKIVHMRLQLVGASWSGVFSTRGNIMYNSR